MHCQHCLSTLNLISVFHYPWKSEFPSSWLKRQSQFYIWKLEVHNSVCHHWKPLMSHLVSSFCCCCLLFESIKSGIDSIVKCLPVVIWCAFTSQHVACHYVQLTMLTTAIDASIHFELESGIIRSSVFWPQTIMECTLQYLPPETIYTAFIAAWTCVDMFKALFKVFWVGLVKREKKVKHPFPPTSESARLCVKHDCFLEAQHCHGAGKSPLFAFFPACRSLAL